MYIYMSYYMFLSSPSNSAMRAQLKVQVHFSAEGDSQEAQAVQQAAPAAVAAGEGFGVGRCDKRSRSCVGDRPGL